jgi:sulfite reductase (NADPH) hemoprotein beta-component
VSHAQNIVLPHVRLDDLPQVHAALAAAGLATPNDGLVTDIIACPGLDYCALANARSIPVAQEISQRFADLDRQTMIGELKLKISGCINACGHHHVGHIGILGVDRQGEEFYQITLGGAEGADCAIGEQVGPGFAADKITDAVETLIETYLKLRRDPGERFLDAYRRVGLGPFQEALYADA